MSDTPTKKPRSVWIVILSVIAVLAGLIVLVPIGAIFILGMQFGQGHDQDYAKIKQEVSRISSNGRIIVKEVECRDVELSAECFVDYTYSAAADVNAAFSASGYEIKADTYSPSHFVATNQSASITAYVSWDETDHTAKAEFNVNH